MFDSVVNPLGCSADNVVPKNVQTYRPKGKCDEGPVCTYTLTPRFRLSDVECANDRFTFITSIRQLTLQYCSIKYARTVLQTFPAKVSIRHRYWTASR